MYIFAFWLFCNVYNETENSNRRLASEIHFFQFVTEHHINISPQVIFLPTREDGTSGLEDNAEYKFSFRIEDKNGNVYSSFFCMSSLNLNENKIRCHFS